MHVHRHRQSTIPFSLLFIAVLLLYLGIWSFANWPALKVAWWSSDDYAVAMAYNYLVYLGRGRPMEGLIHSLLSWETGAYGGLLNVAARFCQGLFHCLSATIAGCLFYQQAKKLSAFAILLLFVVWPLNGEAVLWRVSVITSSAFLALLGIYLIQSGISKGRWLRQILGMGMISLAMLTHQLAAFVGFVVWSVQIALDDHSYWPVRYQECAYIVMAYLFGVFGSAATIRYFSPVWGRAALAVDWQQKVDFVFALNWRFLRNEAYPNWLWLLQLLLLLGTLALLVSLAVTNLGEGRTRALRQCFSLFMLLFLPYAPLLVIQESWASPRNLYLGPFLLVGACFFLEAQVSSILCETRRFQLENAWFHNNFGMGMQTISLRFSAALVVLLICLLIVGYLPIARQNASEYVYVFQQDLQALHAIEVYVQTHDLASSGEVVVATAPGYVRDWNPYNIRLTGDAKNSAFMIEWAAHRFIKQFSWLRTVEDHAIQNSCVELCQRDAIGRPFYFSNLPASTILCVCP